MTSNATSGDEMLVNTYTTSYQTRTTVAALDDGGWIAVWVSGGQDGDSNGVYQQRYDADGAMVGIETRVNTFTTGSQSYSTTTALSDGGWLVAWGSNGQDGDVFGVYQQRYHADGSVFGIETQVNTYTTGVQNEARTTALADGGWVVTWQSTGQDGNDTGIYQQHYNAAGSTVGTEIRVNTITTGSQRDSAVSALANGGWITTWVDQDANISQQRYDADGDAVETDALVNTYTTAGQVGSRVAGLGDGGWLVAWYSDGQDGSSDGIYQQRYDADGDSVGAETKVNTYTTGQQNSPSVTALSDGGWVVVWSSFGQDGGHTGIYQQRYDADGIVAGTETLVNTYTTGEQAGATVTALADGSWVVSWTSDGQDGDDYGVYQRHFAADLVGTAAADTLSGTNWSETLSGNNGADTLKGLGGIDSIDGGKGRDKLYGGAAADIFLFETGDTAKTKAKADTIFDMQTLDGDQIDLHLIDAREDRKNDQAFKFIGTKDFTGHDGELRYDKVKSDTWIYGDTDGDKKADFAIHLDDAMKLKAGDFVL